MDAIKTIIFAFICGGLVAWTFYWTHKSVDAQQQSEIEFTTDSHCNQSLDICSVNYTTWGYLLCYNCGNGFCIPNEAWCLQGDLDYDRDVDLEDFKLFQMAMQ